MTKLIISKKILHYKILQIVTGIILYFILCYLYQNVVVHTFNFGGFNLVDKPNHLVSISILILFLIITPICVKNITSLFIIISFFFLIAPATVLAAMQGSKILVLIYMVMAIILVIIFYKIINKNFKTDIRNDQSRNINFWLPFSIFIAILIFLGLHVNFNMRFSLADVYEFRFDFNRSLSFPLTYLLPFASGPLSGFLTALAISRKNYGKFFLVLFCSVLFFGFSTHKSCFLYPLLSTFIYFSIKNRIGLFYILSLIISASSLISLFSTGFLGTSLGSMFANRLMFIPAQIHYVFFDQFSNVGFLYWSESRVSFGLSESPLSINAVNYIAYIMTGNENISANTGWIANGYMNFGILGIIIYALVLSLILSILNRLSIQFYQPVFLATFSIPMFSIITSNDLLVSLLTGGLLLMIVLVWILSNRSLLNFYTTYIIKNRQKIF